MVTSTQNGKIEVNTIIDVTMILYFCLNVGLKPNIAGWLMGSNHL